MPPKAKITKDEILAASLRLIREGGPAALNARALATALRCSTQPLFRVYATMDDMRADVLAAINAHYARYFDEHIQRSDVPPYKASGLAYIGYARDEPALFKMLFMRDRTPEQMREGEHSYEVAVGIIMASTGLSLENARRLHLRMWITTHGIATLLVTSYLDMDDVLIDALLTDAYRGAMRLFETE